MQVTPTKKYQPLSDGQISDLIKRGCSCEDWSAVEVAEGFQTSRVRGATFSGQVRLGSNTGKVATYVGIEKDCGLYNAHIHNCTIDDDVRIANVGRHVANYDIGPGVCIENVGMLETMPDANFGNGIEVEALNEGGGREIILFDMLDSQFAHLMCVHRYRPKFIEKLQKIARAEAAKVKSDRGAIEAGARIYDTVEMVDVRVGRSAAIDGAASLVSGTVLSSEEAPTTIGAGVQADAFIIAEGSDVSGGAMLSKSFIGQGCRIDKQFSSEGSVFFANCEGLHGEACSVLAGPYTVTHHKSTLLIAGMFSFFNAGSGTNQSNHLYKLGPLHEGKLERGCKTGSYSYMMWPCRLGPFSVILGRHKSNFDTSDFPFSYLDASPEGKCRLTPGYNLTTVGTFRDGMKWPKRDRRKGSDKRDRICFDVLSPFTVGRMLRGLRRIAEAEENTDREMKTVKLGGTEVKRVLLKSGRKFYDAAVRMYLLGKIIGSVGMLLKMGVQSVGPMVEMPEGAVFSERWVDIGGQLMPSGRLEELCQSVESGNISDSAAINNKLDEILNSYLDDEWAWVHWAYSEVFGAKLADATADDLCKMADDLVDAREKFLGTILADAGKEFSEAAQTGFGQDGTPDDAEKDFAAVRGQFDTNDFIKQVGEELAELKKRVEWIKGAIGNLNRG